MAKRVYLAPANIRVEKYLRWKEEERQRAIKEIKEEDETMKLRPLSDRVIVKQSDAEEKTASGIVLPDTAKEKPTKGKVIAVGPGKLDDTGTRHELGVRNGDTVYYGKYSGSEIEIDGNKFVI